MVRNTLRFTQSPSNDILRDKTAFGREIHTFTKIIGLFFLLMEMLYYPRWFSDKDGITTIYVKLPVYVDCQINVIGVARSGLREGVAVADPVDRGHA